MSTDDKIYDWLKQQDGSIDYFAYSELIMGILHEKTKDDDGKMVDEVKLLSNVNKAAIRKYNIDNPNIVIDPEKPFIIIVQNSLLFKEILENIDNINDLVNCYDNHANLITDTKLHNITTKYPEANVDGIVLLIFKKLKS